MKNTNKIFAGRFAVIPFLLFFFSISPARAGEFPLRIDDISELNSTWPLIGSIPFPEGELKDPQAILIRSGNSEVPSQIDVVSRWRDGSIRWALAGFTASPQGKYRVEYGAGVKRSDYPDPLKVSRGENGSFTVDTGAAIYQFDADKLLPEKAWLISDNRRTLLLEGSGAGVYLLDNSGRTARVAGQAAEIENKVLKEGPGRFAVKRTGWYVTDEREKLARAETWIYFSAGTPYVKITHALILTEDTNKVWFKDYGLQFKIPARPSTVYCAVGEEREARKLANGEDEIFLLQSEYPHFAEREYKAMIGSSSGGRDKIIEEFDTAGDWAHGDYGNFGVTVVMPWLSERFPKEISFGERGARAVLWSGRSGKELDFRAKTLVKEYWQAWAEKAPGSPGKEKLSAMERNAQGSARTHDIWFLPRAGSYDGETVRKTAMAGARTPLAMAEPQWLCKTEAMGIPMLHRDTDRFPREEAMISEYWDRFILTLKLFPTNGFIMWGCPSFFQYGTVDKKIMANFYLLVLNDPYGVRREPWRHYARSGERRLYETGHMFSRYSGDWMMAHWDVPESRKERGAFILPQTRENRMLPFIWGDYTDKTYMISGDIGHWLLEYYLTGDERSFSLVEMVKDSFRERVKLNMDKKNYYKYPYPILLLRTLLTLSLTGWDSEFASKNRELAHSLVDLNSQNGMDINSQGGYGPMYKDHRSSHNLAEYYLETGDETVKEAFLKLVDQRYRFDRRLGLVSNKNYDAFTYSIAYWITGEERYRTAVEQTLRSALHASEKHPLSKLLARSPKNPLEWNNYPHHDVLTVTDFHNPFIGMPTAMKLLSEKGWSGKSTPLAARKKIMGGKFLFSHKEGRETRISISFSSRRQETAFEVCPYPETSGRNAVKNVKVEKEQIMSMGKYFLDRPEEYAADEKSFHSYITMPADAPTGLYLIYPDGNEPFTVLDSTSEKAAFYCPEGFWSLSGGSLSYGRSSEGIPMFFRVSEGLKELRIFMGRPAIIKRPDGSVAVEISDNNIGNQAIPVKGKSGIWSIEPHIYSYRGLSTPAFFRLLNVEPLIAFGSPNNLPEDTTGKPENLFMPLAEPAEAMEFVQGISGKALRLSKNRTLAFPAGPAVKDGGYTFFPGNTGTLEFWFRAGRSTYDTPLGLYQYVDTPFLNGPHIVFNHRYRARGHERVIYSTVQVELLERNNGLSNTGFQGEHYFKAGEWTHIAYTWDVREGKANMEGNLSIFINGNKLPFKWVAYGLNELQKSKNFKLSDDGKEVTLGPFDGTMDILRISDIVRYRENFVPSKTAPDIDANTRTLFLFDGTLKGISASNQPVEAK